jgi:hypothetical protein
MGITCETDRRIRFLFHAYPDPKIDTVKILHYVNDQSFGKLQLPDHPNTRSQIETLDSQSTALKWTGWITRSVNRLQPFYAMVNPCLTIGGCDIEQPDLNIWRFYSRIRPGRPNPRSDFYYMVTSSAAAPIPPAIFQADPTAQNVSFKAWSSPGKHRIPIYQCQNRVGRQYWIGNGCEGDAQQPVLFYAYPQQVAGTVRSLHYLSRLWFGKLILPDTPAMKTQIDALDRPNPRDPWTAFINRGAVMSLSPFWVASP